MHELKTEESIKQKVKATELSKYTLKTGAKHCKKLGSGERWRARVRWVSSSGETLGF